MYFIHWLTRLLLSWEEAKPYGSCFILYTTCQELYFEHNLEGKCRIVPLMIPLSLCCPQLFFGNSRNSQTKSRDLPRRVPVMGRLLYLLWLFGLRPPLCRAAVVNHGLMDAVQTVITSSVYLHGLTLSSVGSLGLRRSSLWHGLACATSLVYFFYPCGYFYFYFYWKKYSGFGKVFLKCQMSSHI